MFVYSRLLVSYFARLDLYCCVISHDNNARLYMLTSSIFPLKKAYVPPILAHIVTTSVFEDTGHHDATENFSIPLIYIFCNQSPS